MDSTLSHTQVETFDTMALGKSTNVDWTGVGQFDRLNIKAADVYGGAYNTKYAVAGLSGGNAVPTITLTLNTPSSYFGLWWSAGDGENILDFYSGPNGTGTLLAKFTTANLLAKLQPAQVYPNGYYGNPNDLNSHGVSNGDTGEPFAFINFFGAPGTAWSSIKVENTGSSGFEADNFTSRVQFFDPSTEGPIPGHAVEAINGTQEVSLSNATQALAAYNSGSGMAMVPEPSATWAMVLVVALSFGSPLLRRFRKKA